MSDPRVEPNSPQGQPRVLVTNPGQPELDYLAERLARVGSLYAYVRTYANMRRWWERALAQVPGLGRALAGLLERRVFPVELPLEAVRRTAFTYDLAFTLAGRLAPVVPLPQSMLDALMFRRAQLVDRKGSGIAGGARAAVANYGAAIETFSAVHRSGGRAILNYPIAHHRFASRFLQDEARRVPEFGTTLQFHSLPPTIEARLDRECEIADLILVGSSFARSTFLEQGLPEHRVVAIPYGTDVELFHPGGLDGRDRHARFRVLFVGQIGQRKGISYLLQAYKAFRRSDTSLTLVGRFVGDSRALEAYRGLFDHVPHVPRNALSGLYREADVFVLPTLVEGMPLVVLEAMASGLPAITTANGPGDVVRDGVDGFIVPIRDWEMITDRLDFLYRHRDVLDRMGISARKRAEQFTWETYAKRATDAVLGHIGETSLAKRA